MTGRALSVELNKQVPVGRAHAHGDGGLSRRWKTVTMKVMSGEEELSFPVMQASTVSEVRTMLAESVGVDAGKIDLFEKKGCQLKRLRNYEEIPSKVLVKGISNFGRKVEEYPHPFVLVGAGHLGLRNALHWTKLGLDYVLFERKSKIGGNAWNGIANKWSKLQSEGPHYQLDYDLASGVDSLLPFNKYSYWPTRDEILGHFHDVCTEYNLWPNFVMSTQVMDLQISPAPKGYPEKYKSYQVKHLHVGDSFQKAQDLVYADIKSSQRQLGEITCSCVSFYPGALASPHRKTFPGEEVFGGQVGYGFNDEFNYVATAHQQGVVIGMGAFAVENIRTLMEHNAKKFWVVARHHNLLLPRMLSWYVNQSRIPPPAATVLKAMEPMYTYYGADPWSYHSVQTNADRSVASIKQYTRWGIGDVYFLGVHYGKVETVEGQVKRLKRRAAVITNGRVLQDLDHVVKCLGFDSDFGIDRINHTRRHIGFWPDGDFRRWVASDQSAIDASRFGGTAIAPYALATSVWGTHFFQYPEDAKALIENNIFVENFPKPEVGAAAYHYEPRNAATVQVAYGSAVPHLADFQTGSDVFKKSSMWACAPPERFLEECEKDWFHYCRKFKEFGDDRPFPAYPYTLEWVFDLLSAEEEDAITVMERMRQITKQQGEEFRAKSREAFVKRLADAKEHRLLREEQRFALPQLRQDALEDDKGTLKPLLEDTEWWERGVLEVDKEQGAMFADRHPEARVSEKTKAFGEAETKVLEAKQLQNTSEQLLHTPAAMLPARMVLRMRASAPEFGPTNEVTRSLNHEWIEGAEWVKSRLME